MTNMPFLLEILSGRKIYRFSVRCLHPFTYIPHPQHPQKLSNFDLLAAINHLLDIPQKQIFRYGTYYMTYTASVTWSDLLRNRSQNFLE